MLFRDLGERCAFRSAYAGAVASAAAGAGAAAAAVAVAAAAAGAASTIIVSQRLHFAMRNAIGVGTLRLVREGEVS
jgi:hypothetical protein